MNVLLDVFLSRLGTTRTVRQTWDEMLAFQKSLGFELIMYGYTSDGQAKAGNGVVIMSNFPAAYQIRYRQERYYRQDPVVSHCIANLSPLLVGRDAVCSWPDKGWSLTPIQRRIINEAAECGMKTGVVIPLRSLGCHPIAGMSLSSAMSLKEFQRIVAECGTVAQLAALYAHTRIQMQLQPREEEEKVVALTDRERECLLWASHGLSSKQTANRLCVSSRTVEFHVANAMKKLEAASRVQAVTRAVTLGLMMP
jgi:DNA-binding CsgD family transcriptional regulator